MNGKKFCWCASNYQLRISLVVSSELEKYPKNPKVCNKNRLKNRVNYANISNKKSNIIIAILAIIQTQNARNPCFIMAAGTLIYAYYFVIFKPVLKINVNLPEGCTSIRSTVFLNIRVSNSWSISPLLSNLCITEALNRSRISSSLIILYIVGMYRCLLVTR